MLPGKPIREDLCRGSGIGKIAVLPYSLMPFEVNCIDTIHDVRLKGYMPFISKEENESSRFPELPENVSDSPCGIR
jgi:hypothetical protein